jgi:hypothetical protein
MSKSIFIIARNHRTFSDGAASTTCFAHNITPIGVKKRIKDIIEGMYDPEGKGALLDAQREGFDTVFKRSAELLSSSQPIFEAGFTAMGALALADVMLPEEQGGKRAWRMVEVKSSTGVKAYHRDDVAIQSYIARNAGVPLVSIAVAHIDSDWIYPGEGDYHGLLNECDLTSEAFGRDEEMIKWIADAQQTAALKAEPDIRTGEQCSSPFACGFHNFCRSQEPHAEYPAYWLPGIRTKALKEIIAKNPALELRDTPDDLLNELQRRVKTHTLSGEVYFDEAGAAAALKKHPLPAYFLDFETIQFAVPIWKGTRPYQNIPFQFSLDTLDESGKMESKAFLDLSGNDPSRAFAESLIAAFENTGPIFVYNAGFEGARIKDLADRFTELAPALLAIKDRLVDLHPITKENFYHPCQHGSWSIKHVLPAIAPDLGYEALEGVKDGFMAMNSYLEAIRPDTTSERKAVIEKQLLAYCGLDTVAMVRLWQFLIGRAGHHPLK